MYEGILGTRDSPPAYFRINRPLIAKRRTQKRQPGCNLGIKRVSQVIPNGLSLLRATKARPMRGLVDG